MEYKTDDKLAKLRALRSGKPEGSTNPNALIKYIPASEAKDKIAVVFDDSGSMDGEKIKNAKAGTVEFLRNIQPNSASVSIHLLSEYERKEYESYYEEREKSTRKKDSLAIFNQELATYTTELPLLAVKVSDSKLDARGGTPLYEVIESILKDKANSGITPTRMIAFSDGCPQTWNQANKETLFSECRDKKIPIDTVFIGSAGDRGESEMKEIAEKTGGIFMIFDPSKVNFKTAFAYLAPAKRQMLLADKSLIGKIERGES